MRTELYIPDYDRAPTSRTFTWRAWFRFMRFAAPVTIANFACAFLSYYTIGEIVSGLYLIIAVAGSALGILCSFISRRAAAVILFVFGVLIIPYQAHLGIRWWRVHREAQRIVNYAIATKAATGNYPTTLTGFTFRDPGTIPFIAYTANGNGPSGGPFCVAYYIGTPSTSHWYEVAGYWQYYPD